MRIERNIASMSKGGLIVRLLLMAFLSVPSNGPLHAQKSPTQRPNVVFILTDDHRHDFMGFTGKVPWLQTPGMDRLARDGAWVKNATVTTALCSPSRASMLTGQYAHTHTVVDNFSPLPKDLRFFPEYLQQAGYRTAFFGKWHMGNVGDEPQKGFHHWESFKGQGVYFNPTLNINGTRKTFGDSAYVTDLLTEHAVDWMKAQPKDKPFFMYLSHKGVHDNFSPAKRHRGIYRGKPIDYPSTINLTAGPRSRIFGDTNKLPLSSRASRDASYNVKDIPQWVWKQRDSWHGVDFMYDGNVDFDETYRRYCETLLAVDESISSVLEALKATGRDGNTVVIYMGDNGFLWGEHGLIDKRNMYEESQKVPMLIHAPGLVKSGIVLNQVVQNIDLAPTILSLAGVSPGRPVDGRPMTRFWERPGVRSRRPILLQGFTDLSLGTLPPATGTFFSGIRVGPYKYVRYRNGTRELYDLARDPAELGNRIRDRRYREVRSYMAGLLAGYQGCRGAECRVAAPRWPAPAPAQPNR